MVSIWNTLKSTFHQGTASDPGGSTHSTACAATCIGPALHTASGSVELFTQKHGVVGVTVSVEAWQAVISEVHRAFQGADNSPVVDLVSSFMSVCFTTIY